MSEFGEGSSVPKTHDTLSRQHELRPELHPTKEQEMDFGYAEGLGKKQEGPFANLFGFSEGIGKDLEGPPTNLAVDFDELFKARKELRDTMPLTVEQVIRGVGNLTSEEVKEIYEKVDLRIRKETGYCANNLRSDAMGHIYQSFLKGEKGKPGEPFSEFAEANLQYVIEAFYKGKTPPPLRDVLLTLGTTGSLPDISESGRQEVTRTYPDSRSGREEIGMRQPKKDSFNGGGLLARFHRSRGDIVRKDLVEVAARRAAGEGQIELQTSSDFLARFPYEETGIDSAKAYAALKAVDQLQALGYPPTTIAALLRMSEENTKQAESEGKPDPEWDSLQGTFKTVQAEIDVRAQALHLDELDVEGLIDANKVERQIDRLHAMQIVQDELFWIPPKPKAPPSSFKFSMN